jgi:hypothetical protein
MQVIKDTVHSVSNLIAPGWGSELTELYEQDVYCGDAVGLLRLGRAPREGPFLLARRAQRGTEGAVYEWRKK